MKNRILNLFKNILSTAIFMLAVQVFGQVNPPVTSNPNRTNGCASSITLSVYTTDAPAGLTHKWYTSSTGTQVVTPTVVNTGTSTYVTEYVVTSSVSYWVAARNSSGQESSRTQVTATYTTPNTTPPSLSVNYTGEQCGPSATFSISAGGGGAGSTYNWYETSNTSGSGIHQGTLYTPTLDYANLQNGEKTYWVKGTLTSTNCYSGPNITQTQTITVRFKDPVPQPSISNVSNCGPTSFTLTASGAPAGALYRWYRSDGTQISGQTGNQLNTGSLTTTTDYQVSIVDDGCEGPRADVTATINSIPAVPTGANVSKCGAGGVTVTATPPSGASIEWFDAASGGTSLGTGNDLNTSVTQTATFYAEAIGGNSCRSTSRHAIQVTVSTPSRWYFDGDQDGLGDPAVYTDQCSQPANYVADSTDQCPAIASASNDCSTQSVGDPNPSDQNYIYSRTYQVARDTVPTSRFLSEDDYVQQITYFDGLGRPMQQNAIRQSPDEKDLITHIGYDGFGRQDKDWLPFHDAVGSIGSYRTGDMEDATKTYYDTAYADDFTAAQTTDHNPYAQKSYEASPLNRVELQAAPGDDWKMGSGHEVEMEYSANSTNEVRRFKVNLTFSNKAYTPGLVEDAHYTAGELSKVIMRDENHSGSTKNHTAEQFTDKQGRMILKRTYADTDTDGDGTDETEVAHDTYYVYDDYGNLNYVMPPLMDAGDTNKSAANLEASMDTLGYRYVYDHRNRLVEKQLPGKEKEYVIYNTQDQPIMTQDAEQAKIDEWLFTKYDAFGRVAYTGTATDGRPRHEIQASADASTVNWVSQTTTTVPHNTLNIYYTNDAYPTDFTGTGVTQIKEILTINYYDTYVDKPSGAPASVNLLGTSVVQSTKTQGLATVSRVKVLDVSPAKWIHSLTYYDDKGRPIYVYSHNEYLNATDVVETQLDFIGKPIKVKSSHIRNSSTLVTIDNFTYDHVGRLKAQTQCIGDETLGDSCSSTSFPVSSEFNTAVTVSRTDLATSSITLKAGFSVNSTSGITYEARAGSNVTSSVGQELIALNTYDQLGLLVSKKVGGSADSNVLNSSGLQDIAYEYNVRGWLKQINDPDDLGSSLFGFRIGYQDITDVSKRLYNGNISETEWNSKTLNPFSYPVSSEYSYTYDAMNRILSATDNTSDQRYSLEKVSYDKNGNILELRRKGHLVTDPTQASHYGIMDDLEYAYEGNQLVKVDDLSNNDTGFLDGSNTTDDFDYDDNGNLTKDENKGLTSIAYNHLNLPTNIVVNGNGNNGSITYIYDATGVKLKKIAVEGSSEIHTEYCGNHIYEGNATSTDLKFFSQPEGYVTPSTVAGEYDYVYQYLDHLGNVRLSYTDGDGDGTIDVETTGQDLDNDGTAGENEIVKEDNYYPFGLKHQGYKTNVAVWGSDTAQRWKFGGKEYQEDMDLNWYDVFARNYDPALGRWMNIDPLAEQMRRHSPYNYAFDNPIYFMDPDGMAPLDHLEYDYIASSPPWINNGDGTWTAEAGDSALTLAEDAGISLARANELIENQLGPNYIGKDGQLKSNVQIGDSVDVPESDALTDEEFEEAFLSGRDKGDSAIEVVDTDGDGKLDAGVVAGDTTWVPLPGESSNILDNVTPDKVVPSIGTAVLKKIFGAGAGQMLSTQGLNKYEDGLLERRDLNLPSNATQREVDSARIVNFLKNKKFNGYTKD